MKKLLLTTLLTAGLAVSVTGCEDHEKHDNEAKHEKKEKHEVEEVITKISKGQLSVIQSFKAAGDLEGVVVQPQGGGQQMIMYVGEDEQYVLYGTLIGADGQNLTEQDKSKYITPLLAKKIAENLSMTTQFKEGSDSAPYKMIALADPNCSACHAFYTAAKASIDSGQLQISWIMVYFVQPDSQAKAAAILNAQDPAAAMAENEAKFDSSTEEGGIQALQDIPADLKQKLENNMKFMSNTGIGSTPTLIFYNQSGELTYISGSPSNVEDFLKQNNPQIVAPAAK